jgi:hypothetical protein
MYASPDVLADLTATRDLYFSYLLWSSGAVAIGVALEGPEVIHEARKVLCHVKAETPAWITLVALIGWTLVVLGVLGEGISEALVSRADGNIQAFNDQRFKHEIDARLILEKELLWRGSRDILVNAGRDLFKKQLREFSGQLAYAVVCGSQFLSRGDQEITATAGTLNSVLLEAGWNVDLGDPLVHPPIIDGGCPIIGEAVTVIIRQDASKRTRDAATKLLVVIDEVLWQGAPLVEYPSKYFTVTPLGSTGQWQPTRVLRPDAIEIAVRMHPMRPPGPTIDANGLLKGQPGR